MAVDYKIAGGVNSRGIRLRGRMRTSNRRNIGDLDLHAIRGIFGLRRRRCDDRRDRFADKTHDLIRQDRLLDRSIIVFVQHRLDRLRAEIAGTDDCDSLGRGNPHDAPGGDRAADETHEMRGGKIGGEATAAADQRRVFQAPNRAADPFQSGASGCSVHG